MLSRVTKIIYICIGVMALCRCSTTKPIAPQLSPAEIEINSSIASGNIYKVIDSYYRYGEHRAFLADYLANEVDYSRYSYGELETIAKYAGPDSLLSSDYSFILQQRRDAVCSHFATLDIDAMGSYYCEHSDEAQFLRPLLESTLIATLGSHEYPYIRDVHRAFAISDLSPQIDSIYTIKRAATLPKVKKMVEEYCANERQLLANMQASAMNEIAAYIERGLPIVLEDGLDKINRGILDEIFTHEQTDSLTIREFFEHKVGQVLSQKHIAEVLYGATNDFKQSVESCRVVIAEQLLAQSNSDYSFALQQNYSADNYSIIEIDWRPIEKIEQIKSKVDWAGWGLAIVSLIPGVGIAADAADLIYSLWSENDKSKGINEQLELFATQIGKVINKSVTTNSSSLFDTLNSDLLSTQDSFKQYVYENF